ncbi:MAG: metal-dependent hydrolase [Hahellaceae bacterium]|nr:metal-dependent hydrolase [Hahellaceae bacterium]
MTADTVHLREIASTQGITVRRMDFDFPDSIPEFWCDNNAFLTAMMAGLSVTFPVGERYFIDSVRHYQDEVADPALRAQIRAFIGQEANHSREHVALNEFLTRKGYPVASMEAFVRERLKTVQAQSTPAENLARTVALEHFTAIMAKGFIDHPDFLTRMHPTMARIWAWHSIEEVEHKSVAFDVYRACVNDEKLRRKMMREVTFFFVLMSSVRTVRILKSCGQLSNIRAWLRGLNVLWGMPGVFRQILPAYFAYYRKGFHPSQQADSDYTETVKRHFLQMIS